MDEGDARRAALALPEVTERSSWGQPAWFHRNMVARMWDDERLTVRVEDDGERLALVEQLPELYSTTDHHAGTNLVLITLATVDAPTLGAHLAESWWWAAPPVLRKRYPRLGPPEPA
ncbi:MmcQ/YjbR family DNA-binding protein [Cellulomonas sp. McL0617]|uniref:MmcQ/YjbR family DNA-binding protein n=1 Tax=Cellulomonas sp. McL0617 TaxID=3415675 RepID=UPI003CF03A7D